MTPTDRDDDPTRALDDFVRRMRQPDKAPAAAPDLADLSDLGARLHPATTPARPKGGVLRSGQRWDAAEVEDVPVVELPRQPPPLTGSLDVSLPTVDLQAEQAQAAVSPEVHLPEVHPSAVPSAEAVDAVTRSARDFAASHWDAQAAQAAAPVWQPDPAALQLRPASDARLLARWTPGAWVGAVKLVFNSATEFVNTANGPAVETYPPHRLLLLWQPQDSAGVAGRWPQQAQLLSLPAAQVGAAALALLPDDARLWLQSDVPGVGGMVDWALGADIVLHHTPGLRPFQTDGLRAFIDAERDASFKHLNDGYHQAVAAGPVLRR